MTILRAIARPLHQPIDGQTHQAECVEYALYGFGNTPEQACKDLRRNIDFALVTRQHFAVSPLDMAGTADADAYEALEAPEYRLVCGPKSSRVELVCKWVE